MRKGFSAPLTPAEEGRGAGAGDGTERLGDRRPGHPGCAVVKPKLLNLVLASLDGLTVAPSPREVVCIDA